MATYQTQEEKLRRVYGNSPAIRDLMNKRRIDQQPNIIGPALKAPLTFARGAVKTASGAIGDVGRQALASATGLELKNPNAGIEAGRALVSQSIEDVANVLPSRRRIGALIGAVEPRQQAQLPVAGAAPLQQPAGTVAGRTGPEVRIGAPLRDLEDRVSVIPSADEIKNRRDLQTFREREAIGKVDNRDLPVLAVGGGAQPAVGEGGQQFQLRSLIDKAGKDTRSIFRGTRTRGQQTLRDLLDVGAVQAAYNPNANEEALARRNAMSESLQNQSIAKAGATQAFDTGQAALAGEEQKQRGAEVEIGQAEREANLISKVLSLPADSPERKRLISDLRTIRGSPTNLDFKVIGGRQTFEGKDPDYLAVSGPDGELQIIQPGANAAGVTPTREEFLKRGKKANPTYSDDQLNAIFDTKYGNQ